MLVIKYLDRARRVGFEPSLFVLRVFITAIHLRFSFSHCYDSTTNDILEA